MRRAVFVGVFSFGLGLVVAACGDSGSSDDCMAGSLYCACASGQCLGNLECVANVCTFPGGETGNPGDGDPGDGDPGDGDPGDGDGDNSCGPGLTLCQGECVNTQTDPLHCGGCAPCNAGEVCDSGNCKFIDDCTMTPCPGLSYCDLASKHCLPGCINDDQCNGGQICNIATHDCECGANVGQCSNNSDCPADAYCYSSQCGECSSDAHCQFGCTPPKLDGDMQIGPDCLPLSGSRCNDGSLGAGCETSAACQPGLTCEVSFEVLNQPLVRTCSSCSTDANCNGGLLCTPVVDVQNRSGHKECLPPGSLAKNKPCDLSASGDQTCATGICAIANVQGLDEVGVCGDCKSSADCGGATCNMGSVNLQTGVVTGSTCN